MYKDGKKIKTETATESSNWQCVFVAMDENSKYEIQTKDIIGYVLDTSEFDIVATHEALSVLRQNKIDEMNEAQQNAIQAGTDVVMSDGTVEHFTLTDHDQTSIIALAFQVAQGATKIPWHTSNHDEGCKYYSAEDMNKLIEAAMFAGTWQVTYFRDLRRYILSLNDANIIKLVTYGMDIPLEFQSEVLKDLIAQKVAMGQ